MPNQSLKWCFFILFLAVVHYVAITALLQALGILQPFGLFLAGVAWVWFGMPKVNAWMVMHTPFKKVWDWAQS